MGQNNLMGSTLINHPALQTSTTIIADIFDTILSRKVHPEMIKKIVAARVCDHIDYITPLECYIARENAEIQSYQNSLSKYGDEEIDYAEMTHIIYQQLKDKLGDALYFTADKFYELHQQIELAVEKRNVILNTEIVDFLYHQKQLGKQIILLSDFYLPKTFVKELLKHLNIDDIYHTLIVSADVFKTKRSGKLYQELLDKKLIEAQKTLIIGDNIHSDIHMAQMYKLNTFHIKRDKLPLNLHKPKKFINEIKQSSNKMPIFGHFSCLLMCVVSKLYKQCLKNNAKDLYFFAREGEIVKLLFDKYQKHLTGNNPIIKTHYLIVSRRSTLSASLKSIKSETFSTLFRQYTSLSIKQFALSLGFDEKILLKFCLALNLNIDENHENFPTSSAFIKLKTYPSFIKYYEKTRIEQKQNFLTYFNSLAKDEKYSPIHVFDVGWKGTIQDNLAKIFNDRQLFGYYIGLVANGDENAQNRKQGLLFDYRQRDKNFKMFTENTSLFEIILSAFHGSAIRYVNNNAELENNPLEQKVHAQYITPLQQQIISQFEILLITLDNHCKKSDDVTNYCIKQHRKKIFTPTKSEVAWYQNIVHFENFGLFTYTKVSKHWIPAKLTGLNLRIMLPFYKLYRLGWTLAFFENKAKTVVFANVVKQSKPIFN